MYKSSKDVLRHQLMFIGCSIGLSFIFTFMFGFLVCSIINTVLFIAIVFYIRRQRLKALGKFGSGEETTWRGTEPQIGGRAKGLKLKYLCLVCGLEVSSRTCKSCGSQMKKPVL
jgi:hypothetical protein